MVPAAAAADRVFLQGPPARAWSCACRGSRPASPATAATNRAVSVAIPLSRWRKFSAGPLQRQDRPDRAGDLRDHVARSPAGRRRRGAAASARPSSNWSTSRATTGSRRAPRRPGARTGPTPRAWLGIVAVEVMSPTWPRSSAERQVDQRVGIRRLGLAELEAGARPWVLSLTGLHAAILLVRPHHPVHGRSTALGGETWTGTGTSTRSANFSPRAGSPP